MADDSNDQADEPDDGPAGDQQNEPDQQPPSDDVRRMQTALRKANREAETTRLKLKEYEDRDKSDAERAAERATEAEQRAQQAETALLRMRVATSKGLPVELADRLQGSDEKEMGADADRLLSLMKPRNGTSVPRGAQPDPGATSMNDLIRQAAGRG